MLLTHLVAFSYWPASQNNQDRILESLFGKGFGLLTATNRFCVEFGFAPNQPGSNTWQLRKNVRTGHENRWLLATNRSQFIDQRPYQKSWKCMLIDNSRVEKSMTPAAANMSLQSFFVRSNITSLNIGGLFSMYSVPRDVDCARASTSAFANGWLR